ncbi:hypothetical protein CPB85DRAFT_1293944 [Mucidula mucida]|nr:hypothetical protein CPB85DRAFT_1293944 [Mucidula mucida]
MEAIILILFSILPEFLCAPTSSSSISTPSHLDLPSTGSSIPSNLPLPLFTGLPQSTWTPPVPPSKSRFFEQKPFVLFFEFVAVLFAFAAVLSIIRCVISYRRTPRQDRIAAVIRRAEMYQEMASLEDQYHPIRRRSSLKEPPPPPYFPKPPEYDTAGETPPPSPAPSTFVNVDITCPPPSPTNRRDIARIYETDRRRLESDSFQVPVI